MVRRVAVTGAAGRMGAALCAQLQQHPGLRLEAALERPMAPAVGRDVGELAGCGRLGVVVSDDPEAALGRVDVLVDFSSPQATVRNAELCAARGLPLVVGTTGLTASQRRKVEAIADRSALCIASNFSAGITLCLRLAEMAAAALGNDVDVEVIEAHHRHKVDAPSGTALSLGRAVAAGRGQDFEAAAVYTREGLTGPRPDGAIGFATIRGGDIVGDHTVLFAAHGERIEIAHRAGTRAAFARGALRAAQWLCEQPPGCYDMQDVLGLRDNSR